MKRLTTLLLCAFALPVAAQVYNPPAAKSVICKISSPISNTGNTGTNTYLAGSACQIPAGTLGPNSQIYVTAMFARTSGTGNCNPSIWAATSSGTLTTSLVASGGQTTVVDLTAFIINAGSLSSQNSGGVAYGATFATGSSTPISLGINTATTPIFINLSQNNSVGTDNCSVLSEVVEVVQ